MICTFLVRICVGFDRRIFFCEFSAFLRYLSPNLSCSGRTCINLLHEGGSFFLNGSEHISDAQSNRMWLRQKTIFFSLLALLCSFDARWCLLKQFVWQLRKRTDDLHSALHDAVESPACHTYTWNCIMTGVCHWRCLLQEPWLSPALHGTYPSGTWLHHAAHCLLLSDLLAQLRKQQRGERLQDGCSSNHILKVV